MANEKFQTATIYGGLSLYLKPSYNGDYHCFFKESLRYFCGVNTH